jgi:hypothetical protein
MVLTLMDGGDAKPGPGTNAVRDKFARIYAGAAFLRPERRCYLRVTSWQEAA